MRRTLAHLVALAASAVAVWPLSSGEWAWASGAGMFVGYCYCLWRRR